MYKYAYETISCHLEGWGPGAGNVYCIDEYRFIIEKRALEGWRYKFVAKNPHACVWDESHISLDIYLEKNI